MAFVPEVTEDRASQDLRQHYAAIREIFGFLPRFFQAQGSRPDVVQAELELWRTIYRAGTLPQDFKEKIGLVVSGANVNSYCIAAHLELLSHLGVEKKFGRQLTRDYERADVPEREKVVFRLAEKITRQPFEVKEHDIGELRRHGWNDAAILEICLVASHFNFLNRVSASLGLVPDDVF